MIKSNNKVYAGRRSGKRVTNTNPLQMLRNTRASIGNTYNSAGVVQSGMGGRNFKPNPVPVVRHRTAKDLA